MQYYGYLRRNPNDPQDTDYTGYDFWLTKLNQFNGNFVNADMVQAFIVSGRVSRALRTIKTPKKTFIANCSKPEGGVPIDLSEETDSDIWCKQPLISKTESQ
jgi:hypothetical protein